MANQEIVIKYSADVTGMKAQLDELTKRLGNVEKKAKGAGDAAEDAFDGAEKSAAKLGSSMDSLSQNIVAAFSIGAIIAFGTKVAEITGRFEKFEAVLTNTLGSKSAAQKALSDIKEFAATTPFSVQELTDSYIKLANQGFKPTLKEMTKLGDLASSTGKGFDQLTEAIIDAQVGEFERLKEFGIRAQKEGDKVTFTFKGVQTQTDFTAASIQKYVLGLGEAEGVTGSMAAISETLEGRISNMGDAWDNFLVSLGTDLKPIITSVLDGLEALMEGVGGFSKNISAILTGSLGTSVAAKELETLGASASQANKLVAAGIEPITAYSDEGKALGMTIKALNSYQETYITNFQKSIKAAKSQKEIDAELAKTKSQIAKGLAAETAAYKAGKRSYNDYIAAVTITKETLELLDAEYNNFHIPTKEKATEKSKTHKKAIEKEIGAYQKLQKAVSEADEILKNAVAERKDAMDEAFLFVGAENNLKKVDARINTLKDIARGAKEMEVPMPKPEDITQLEAENQKAFDKAAKDRREKQEKDAKEEADLRKQQWHELRMIGINAAEEAAMAQLEIQRNYAEIQKERDLANLEEEYKRKINSANLTNRDKLRLEQEYQSKQELIEREAFRKRQQLEIAGVVIKSAADTAKLFSAAAASTASTGGIPNFATILLIAQIAAIAASTATQIAVIKSQKFAKGTSWLDRGGNPAGTDTIPILADEGERIISRKDNVENWDLYEAIRTKKFDKYVMRNYIAPALKEQQKEFDRMKSQDFATNLANSLMMQSGFYDGNIITQLKIGRQAERENAKMIATAIGNIRPNPRRMN